MNPTRNPFSPGSGSTPPFLAGRDGILGGIGIAYERIKIGHNEQNILLLGLRGVGKTVLLRTAQNLAIHAGVETLMFEADDGRPLRGLIASRLRSVLLKHNAAEKRNVRVKKGLQVLAGFAKAVKLKHGDIELALDFDPLLGVGDSGNLEDDLPDLFIATGEALQSRNVAVTLIIDELHLLPKDDLVALIKAMHVVSQHSLPIFMIGGGLPQVAGMMGAAKGYSERLYRRHDVGPLQPDAAKKAITEPLERNNASISKKALDEIVAATMRYPYFLQEWGKHAWNCAKADTIDVTTIKAARPIATASLDESFFSFRMDQLTDREKQYARAMASLGPGPYKSGDVAGALKVHVESLGPIRGSLIKKGTIYSPSYGDTAFTVPLFHEFLCRAIPSFSSAPTKKAPAKKKSARSRPKKKK